ncbi:hypothetical protein QTP86_030933 [Hemibagrus guttatus]|nr:hypothetical protein QTP86_030933 [Hemibagrus guttatus]
MSVFLYTFLATLFRMASSSSSSSSFKVICNCFSVSDGELQDVGLGLYPSMSLLNHNCRPNCVMMFSRKKLELRAVRRIQQYEELCISYTDILAPRVERRTQLMDQFHFLCQCQRCSNDQSDCTMLGGEESRWMIIRHSMPHLETLQHEEKWVELQKVCQALICSNSPAVPDSNVYMLRVLNSLMDACISLSQYETALQYGTRTLNAYMLHYPDPHPSHAVQLLRVAKLQHYCGDVEQAERTFTQAYNVMKVTHGTHHPLVSEHIPQMLDWIEIWGIWRPSQLLKLVVVVIKPFLNHFCFVARRIILLKEDTAIRE